MGDIFNLKKLLLKKAKQGELKVYSFKESMEICKRINKGLPEFQRDRLRCENIARAKQRRVFIQKKHAFLLYKIHIIHSCKNKLFLIL